MPRMFIQTILGFVVTVGMSWLLLAIVRWVLRLVGLSPFEVTGTEILLGSVLLLLIMNERRSSIWTLVK